MAFENLDNSIIFFRIANFYGNLSSYILLGQRRSIKLAIFTAIIGSIVYGAYYSTRKWFFCSFGGIAWLLALNLSIEWFAVLDCCSDVWIITTV